MTMKGDTTELVEMPIMFGVILYSARWIVRRFHLAPAPSVRLRVGGIALSLLLLAELSLMSWLQGISLAQYLGRRDPVALVAFALVFINRRASGVAISAILASFWTWMALAYHVASFARINPLAYAFAAISIAGSLAFLWQGVFRNRLQFGFISLPGAVLAAA